MLANDLIDLKSPEELEQDRKVNEIKKLLSSETHIAAASTRCRFGLAQNFSSMTINGNNFERANCAKVSWRASTPPNGSSANFKTLQQISSKPTHAHSLASSFDLFDFSTIAKDNCSKNDWSSGFGEKCSVESSLPAEAAATAGLGMKVMPKTVNPLLPLSTSMLAEPKKNVAMKTFEHLKFGKKPICDFLLEKEILLNYARGFAQSVDISNVYFNSPVAEYLVTTTDEIKIIVYGLNACGRLQFTVSSSSTVREILFGVLGTLFSSVDAVPVEEYLLKIYGTDEVLALDAMIGKHTFVHKTQLSQKQQHLTGDESHTLKFNYETCIDIISTIQKHFDEYNLKPDIKHLQGIIQCIKLLTTTLNNVQPTNLVRSVDRIVFAASSEEQVSLAVDEVVQILYELMRAYGSCAPINFSVEICETLERCLTPIIPSLLTMDEDEGIVTHSTHQRDECAAAKAQDISTFCNNTLLTFEVQSLHNIPNEWSSRFHKFAIEVHLMCGAISYGRAISLPKKLSHADDTLLDGFNHATPISCDHTQQRRPRLLSTISSRGFVHFSFWVGSEDQPNFTIPFSSLPRESVIVAILRALPKFDESTDAAASASTKSTARQSTSTHLQWQQLADCTLPLFDHQGFLRQGLVLLPMSCCKHRQKPNFVGHHCGAREILRSHDDPVLLVQFIEFDYRICFSNLPSANMNSICWKEFSEIASSEDREYLQTLILQGSGQRLSDDDKQLLWSYRNYLRSIDTALPLVLMSTSCFNRLPSLSVNYVHLLLENWCDLRPEVAVQLLLPAFPNIDVRSKAIDHLRRASTHILLNFIPEFVEALRFELYENSPLAFFLVEQSTRNRQFAFDLYWFLDLNRLPDEAAADQREDAYACRCRLLQQSLLGLGLFGFSAEIERQRMFLRRLLEISEFVKRVAGPHAADALQASMFQLDEDLGGGLRLPINPALLCTRLLASECSCFNSLNRPFKVSGDDLRQDAVAIRLVQQMNEIWMENGLDLKMKTYKILPTGERCGLIELVEDAITLREIQSGPLYKDNVIDEWLKRHNDFRYWSAMENFRSSCAGWCVATYVLGIGDRHNDNILVTTTGQVFHIDFGKYFGDWQTAAGFRRDRVPFVLTNEMVKVINGGADKNTTRFQQFIDDTCRAFNLLRANSSRIITRLEFLCESDIPGINAGAEFLRTNLMLNLDNHRATAEFTRMIETTLSSLFPKLNFIAHTLAQCKQNPIMAFGGRPPGIERLMRQAFENDGRIESVFIESAQKWYLANRNKIYMYLVKVHREHEQVASYVYRSFDDFQTFHKALCSRFSAAIPPLTQTTQIGRTNTKFVAIQLLTQLQTFLNTLFSLHDEVSHSEEIYEFFHTRFQDFNPEAVQESSNSDVPNPFFETFAAAQPRLFVRLIFDMTIFELKIFVGHAQKLPLTEKEAPNTYVKAYLIAPQYQHQKLPRALKRKTRVVNKSQHPTYNEILAPPYQLTPPLPHSCNNCSPLTPNHHEQRSQCDCILNVLSEYTLDVSIWFVVGQLIYGAPEILCKTFLSLGELFSQSFKQQTRKSDEAKTNKILTVEDWYCMELARGGSIASGGRHRSDEF